METIYLAGGALGVQEFLNTYLAYLRPKPAELMA
jgi:hypothetical protein